MTSFQKQFATLALIGLGAAHGALPVRAGETALSVGPQKAINMLVGTKRAVGYYTAGNGACNLNLLVAEKFFDDDKDIPTAARFSSVIGAGTSANVATLDGSTLAFTCTAGAKSMKVEKIDRVAWKNAAKS